MSLNRYIIFFDGYCGLCDQFVTKIFEWDQKRVLHFAPLQGPTASSLLGKNAAPDSVVFLKGQTAFYKARAVIEIMKLLGGRFRVLAALLSVVPLPFANWIYDWVARNRYVWFNKKDSCRLPTPTEKQYFLD